MIFKENLTEILDRIRPFLLPLNSYGLDNKMMEETRNKWTLLKEKIEWDAVETIPILLYTDNFTLLSVYKRGIKSNDLYMRK